MKLDRFKVLYENTREVMLQPVKAYHPQHISELYKSRK